MEVWERFARSRQCRDELFEALSAYEAAMGADWRAERARAREEAAWMGPERAGEAADAAESRLREELSKARYRAAGLLKSWAQDAAEAWRRADRRGGQVLPAEEEAARALHDRAADGDRAGALEEAKALAVSWRSTGASRLLIDALAAAGVDRGIAVVKVPHADPGRSAEDVLHAADEMAREMSAEFKGTSFTMTHRAFDPAEWSRSVACSLSWALWWCGEPED